MKAIRQTLKAIYKNALKFDRAFIVDTPPPKKKADENIFFARPPFSLRLNRSTVLSK